MSSLRPSDPRVTALEHPWAAPAPPGETIAVAPGIHWLRLPLPFRLDHINVWLLEDADGLTVVDTGVALDDSRRVWERALAGAGERRVARVIVTHFHPDHMGNAAWLGERGGADLWCAQAEWLTAQLAWRSRDPADLEARLAHYRRHGSAQEALERLRRAGNHYPELVPAVPPAYRRLRDGDALAIGGRRWEVLVGQGHSPEHVCLWSAEARVLIAGDQVLPSISTNVSVSPHEPWGNALRLYLDSLARFAPLAPDALVLPSHGLPFRGLPARLADLRDHHAARLARTLDALAAPRTAADLLAVLFQRELDTQQVGFAMGEALAHLHLLEADGQVRRLVGDDGVHRFVKL